MGFLTSGRDVAVSRLGQAFGDLSQPLCDLCEEVSRFVRVGWGLGSTPPSDYNRLTRALGTLKS